MMMMMAATVFPVCCFLCCFSRYYGGNEFIDMAERLCQVGSSKSSEQWQWQ
jgi:hypothetical protein